MSASILFVCHQNSVRSPMAAALLRERAPTDARIDSAGVYEGALDPFVELVMGELSIAMGGHEPKALEDVDLGGAEVLIALTPSAAIALRKKAPDRAIEFWDVENPSDERGSRDAVVEAYRRVRDELATQVCARFPELCKKP